jgi:hypothetical protein
MPAPVTSDDVKNELKATLAARHEVGVAYDDHFVDAFMEKLKAQVIQEVRNDLRPAPARPRAAPMLTVERRLKIALISLALCPVLLGFALLTVHPFDYNPGGLVACLVLLCVILLLNLAMNLRFKG